jgi:hypothetical protein
MGMSDGADTGPESSPPRNHAIEAALHALFHIT